MTIPSFNYWFMRKLLFAETQASYNTDKVGGQRVALSFFHVNDRNPPSQDMNAATPLLKATRYGPDLTDNFFFEISIKTVIYRILKSHIIP